MVVGILTMWPFPTKIHILDAHADLDNEQARDYEAKQRHWLAILNPPEPKLPWVCIVAGFVFAGIVMAWGLL